MTKVTNGFFITLSAFFLTIIIISIFFIDRSLAIFIRNNLGSINETITPAILFIETAFGFTISKYLFGFIAILVGLIFYTRNRNFNTAKLFFFVGLTHIASRLTAGILKNLFLRVRPYEYLNSGDSTKDFFSEGSSFPSAHTAHFFGLFLPILTLYPKYKWLLILPVFVALSRIIANDHYLSDVAAGIYISILFTWLFVKVFKIK
jgi:membrane-associated phospholipid phosphatase